MAKLKFSNYDRTQRYQLGHTGGVDVTVNTSMLAKNNFASLEDVHEILRLYGKSIQYDPKPELKINTITFPKKPNQFDTTLGTLGFTVSGNDKVRKATFNFTFGSTNDDDGNNPQIFATAKHWVCLEEWRYDPTDKEPLHVRVGHTLNGMVNRNTLDIYFREDYIFTLPGTTKLSVKYKLFMLNVKDIKGSSTSMAVANNSVFKQHKPTVDIQTGYEKTTCNLEVYAAEEKSYDITDIKDEDTLRYNELTFVFKPGFKAGEEDAIYSKTPVVIKGNLPIPNFLELNFDSHNLKKNPYFKGTDQEWKDSLIYRIPITPEDFKEVSSNIAPEATGRVLYLTNIPNFFMTRIYPGSSLIELQVRYGYSGSYGDVVSPYSLCQYCDTDTHHTGGLTHSVGSFNIPRVLATEYTVTYGVLQTQYNINKYPSFTAVLKPDLLKLSFIDILDNIETLLMYYQDYPTDLDQIQNEVIKSTYSFYDAATNGNVIHTIEKDLTLVDFSNALRFGIPLLYKYEKDNGIEANKDYHVNLKIDLTNCTNLVRLMGLQEHQNDSKILEFPRATIHTSRNVVEPTTATQGGLLDKPTSVDEFTYYGEIAGNDIYGSLRYTGDFNADKEYTQGDEFKIEDRVFGYYNSTTPGKVTDPKNDTNVTLHSSLGDAGKLPTIQEVFNILGLSNENFMNYGVLPYNCSKAEVNYPDMEATVQDLESRWVKTMGPEHKLLYISRGSYIDSAYQLAFLRRGMLGSGRTFRFGNHLYKLRLLAAQPRSALEYSLNSDLSDSAREFEIVDHLLRGDLGNYTPMDLGMEATNDHKEWSYTGYPYGPELRNTLEEKTSDTEFSNYFEGNAIGRYKPYKEIRFKAKDTVTADYTVSVESDSEFIDNTKLKWDETTREVVVEFFNLPDDGMNAWQVVTITLDQKDTTSPNPKQTVVVKAYLATDDVLSVPTDEYELMGQDNVRIFNPNYLGYKDRFRQLPHEFFGFKGANKNYGAFPQIVLNTPIVLEQIIPGYEPYNKSVKAPGNESLTYNAGLDIGYYGEVEGRDFFKPSEIKSYLKLSTLKLEGGDEIYYYKCYYHGSIYYIPNRPIGKVKVSELVERGLLFGYDSPYTLNSGELKFKAMLLNTSTCFDHHKGRAPSYKLNELEIGGLFKDLLCRVTTKYDNLVPVTDKFTTSAVDLEIPDDALILTKDIVGDPTVAKNYNALIGDEIRSISEDEEVSYLPVLFIEATDYNQDLVYPEGGYEKYTVTKVEKTYEETYFEKQKITKKRRVDKVRIVKTFREETKIIKVPNGVHTTPVGSKVTEEPYGLIAFACSQRDLANIQDPLYERTMMDIRKQGGELKALYGDFITSYKDVLTKPYIIGGLDGRDIRMAKPFHIMQFFDTFNMGVDFIQSLTDGGQIIRISNDAYKDPYNIHVTKLKDELKEGEEAVTKYPNLIAGCIASSQAVMTSSGAYKIEKRNDLVTDIHISVDAKGNVDSNWVKLKDNTNREIQVPYTNPMVKYQQLSVRGQDYAKNLVDYLKQIRHIDKTSKPEDMCFGFVVVRLAELAYCELGLVRGTIFTPDLNELDEDYIQDYFGDTGGNRSKGDDFIDLFKRIEGTTDKIVLEMVPEFKEESYVDFENYDTLVDVKKKRTKKVMVDKIVYG